MHVIGLTGRSGSGKTLVARVFSDFGIPVFDADAVYHSLVDSPSPCTEALRLAFGDAVLTARGALNRPYMASLVFGATQEAPTMLKTLNKITHGFVRDAFSSWSNEMEALGHIAVVLDAPTLFEAGMDRICDVLIGVVAPHDVAVSRIAVRDSIPREAAERRLSNQVTEEYLRQRCSFVIDNDGDEAGAVAKTQNIIFELKERGIIQ